MCTHIRCMYTHTCVHIYSACTHIHVCTYTSACTHIHVHMCKTDTHGLYYNIYTCTCTLTIQVIPPMLSRLSQKLSIARRRQQQLLVWIYTWNHFVSTNESCTASPCPSSLGSPQEKLTMQGRNINPTHACIHTTLLTHK